MKFVDLIKLGKEAVDAIKAPFEAKLAENNLNGEIIKLEQQVAEADLKITEQKSNKKPNWSSILESLDSKELLERQLVQMKALKEELF